MIKYDNLDYSMIKQIQVRWHFNDDGSRVRHAYSRIIGQKFLASSGFHEIQNCDLFPLFGENNEILGTQLFEGKGDESHAIQIRNIK